MKKTTFGLTTFLEKGIPDSELYETDHERINNAVKEIILADEVGLDYYGIGEHHREDYAASVPQIILAAAALQTKNIHLGSAVTVISSEEPIRLFESFSTLDNLSNGRTEIMAGRGSFLESFELFGYNLNDYNTLFEEKLAMLLKIRENQLLNWNGGKHTPKVVNKLVIPKSVQDKLKVSIAVGGTPESVVRAAKLGLPIVFAIIGGEPIRFKPLIDLYKRFYIDSGHSLDEMEIGIHVHGIIGNNKDELIERYFTPVSYSFNKLGKERGWSGFTKDYYYQSIKHGHLFVGDYEDVSRKIIKTIKELGINRFLLHTPGSYMPHKDVMESIELYGKMVVPLVKKELNIK